jgi:hypothetical protein
MLQAVCPGDILREQEPGKLPALSKRASNVALKGQGAPYLLKYCSHEFQ